MASAALTGCVTTPASRIAEQSQVLAKTAGKVVLTEVKSVDGPDGRAVVMSREGELQLVDAKGRVRSRYTVPYAAVMSVKEGVEVARDAVLFEWDPYTSTIITDRPGLIKFEDIIDILRNEGPLYLFYNDSNHVGILATADKEPVGEGE